jgi:hypothetical protein
VLAAAEDERFAHVKHASGGPTLRETTMFALRRVVPERQYSSWSSRCGTHPPRVRMARQFRGKRLARIPRESALAMSQFICYVVVEIRNYC